MILNRSGWPMDGAQTGKTTPTQSGSMSNGNEGALQTPQISWFGASKSDTV